MAHQRMKIKTGDTVIVLTGSDKKKTGKVTAVDYENGRVQIDGLHIMTKHNKAQQANQPGSIEKKNRFVNISNVSIVHPTKKTAGSRVGFVVDDKGNKKRVYRQAGNKEIK